jgi:hypothetical protein
MVFSIGVVSSLRTGWNTANLSSGAARLTTLPKTDLFEAPVLHFEPLTRVLRQRSAWMAGTKFGLLIFSRIPRHLLENPPTVCGTR